MSPGGTAALTQPGRVRLRRPTPADLEDVVRIHGDPRTNVHDPAGPDRDRAASEDRLRGWLSDWADDGVGYWVVEAADAPGVVVGFTGVRHSTWLGAPVLNLYYRYAAEHHGRGYATEGARHAVGWAQDHRPALPVLANTTRDNLASQRTARAAGLRRRPELEHLWNGRWSVVLTTHWPHDPPTLTLLDRTTTADEADAIATWDYPAPFERYSHTSLDPALFRGAGPDGDGYHPAVDGSGGVVAFCVLGAEARVPGQAAEPGTVDLGMGVHPRLTGNGVGTALLRQAVELARSRPGARRVRVVVAADNARSLALCTRAGLRRVHQLDGRDGRPFVELVGALSRAGPP